MKILYEYRVLVYRILFKANIQFHRSIANEGVLRPVIIGWVQSIALIIWLPEVREVPVKHIAVDGF